MKRRELNVLKTKAVQRKEKSGDMDILIAALLQLPPGQLKKLLTEEVLQVLAKYGYREGG